MNRHISKLAVLLTAQNKTRITIDDHVTLYILGA
jgi:hypothetical protein